MIALFLTLALASQCPQVLVVNNTKVWNEDDQKTLDFAKVRCAEIYPDAPCIKKFIKKSDTNYNVVCGV